MPINQDLQVKFMNACYEGDKEEFDKLMGSSYDTGLISYLEEVTYKQEPDEDKVLLAPLLYILFLGYCKDIKDSDKRSVEEIKKNKLYMLGIALENLAPRIFKTEGARIKWDNLNITLLSFGIENSFYEAIEMILERCAELEEGHHMKEYVNLPTTGTGEWSEEEISFPLHYAVLSNLPGLVEKLLISGAIPNKKTNFQSLDLILLACRKGFTDIVKVFTRHGIAISKDEGNPKIKELLTRILTLSQNLKTLILKDPFDEDVEKEFKNMINFRPNSDIIKSAINYTTGHPVLTPLETAAKCNGKAMTILQEELQKPPTAIYPSIDIKGDTSLETDAKIETPPGEDYDLTSKLYEALLNDNHPEIKRLIVEKRANPALPLECLNHISPIIYAINNKKLACAVELVSNGSFLETNTNGLNDVDYDYSSITSRLIDLIIERDEPGYLNTVLDALPGEKFYKEECERFMRNGNDASKAFREMFELSQNLKESVSRGPDYMAEWMTIAAGTYKQNRIDAILENKEPGLALRAINFKFFDGEYEYGSNQDEPKNLLDYATGDKDLSDHITSKITELFLRKSGVEKELQLEGARSPSKEYPSVEPRRPSAGAASGTSNSRTGIDGWWK